MDISFISVNFRSGVALERLLSSLVAHFRGSDIKVEYIVVNNDTDERLLVESLKERFPGLKTIHVQENIGFGRANQLGSEEASGKLLFFINPDTIFKSGNFQGLLSAFDFHPHSIFGMALEQSDGQREKWSSGEFPSLFRLIQNNLSLFTKDVPWEAQCIQPTDWVSGAALVLRKEFFQELSGFDPEFFLYFEDVDLARRSKEKGARVAVYPFIRFSHRGGGSIESVVSQKRSFYASQLRYFEKWRPRYEALILRWLQWIFHCR